MVSLQQMRRNVWSGLLTATDQEIRDGIDFYPGAHGLCRMFSKIFGLPVESVAGIYAALSPMNGWESNVSDVLSVLRFNQLQSVDLPLPKTNTPRVNRNKALRIALGFSPESILGGRKVTAFYRAIAHPSDPSPIPVDRHLICLALGSKFDKNQLSRIVSDKEIYSRVERVYSELGQRERLGNRLASIAWFVQRRNRLSGQSGIGMVESTLSHCGRPMWSHGRNPRRFMCSECRVTIKPDSLTAMSRGSKGVTDFLCDIDLPSVVSRDDRGRLRISLPRSHPFANSGGWQYLARYVVMTVTQETLRRHEHVHHINGDLSDCRTENLEVMLAENHGRLHGRYQTLYLLRDRVGRFMKTEVPNFSQQYREMGADPRPSQVLSSVPF